MKANKPLTILFDANPIAFYGKSGVGHYASYLIQALAAASPNVQLIGHYYDFLGRKHPADLPTAPNISYRPTRLFPGRVTNMLRRLGISVPFEILIKHRGDILLFPNFLTQPSLFGRPIVVTIHDLCFVKYPEFVSDLNLHDLRRYVPQSIKRASLVLAVSEFTKRSIADEYHVSPAHILTTPVPPFKSRPLSVKDAGALVAGFGITKSFILFVGNLEPRKNLTSLVEAYTLLPKKLKDRYSLVLAGGKGWKNKKLMSRIGELQSAGVDIILPGYITDDEKTALYQKASLVTLPSYYEGFGMPVLEAFEFNVPVAASDIPVFHETAEGAAAYYNPHDIGSIVSVLTNTLEDAKLRQQLIEREPEIKQKYSWTETAEQLIKIIEELV